MNAAMLKYDRVEDTDMPTNENEALGIQVGELRADVRHIQSDVTDIKADLRITNQRIESLEQRVDTKIEKVDQKIESVRKDTIEIRESLWSAKIWALWLYIGLAGSLFYVLARGFKWI
jgi:hypothetical protein